MSKKVLVVIDMQKDFLESDGKLSLGKDTTEFKARVAKRIEEQPNEDDSILVTYDTHEEDSSEFSQFPPHCVKGTEGRELSDEIEDALYGTKDRLFSIISKPSFAGDEATGYLCGLLEQGAEFEFIGVCTHICVHDSIAAFYHAAKAKFNIVPTITVQRDLVDDFDDEMAEGALKRMERLYNVKVI